MWVLCGCSYKTAKQVPRMAVDEKIRFAIMKANKQRGNLYEF